MGNEFVNAGARHKPSWMEPALEGIQESADSAGADDMCTTDAHDACARTKQIIHDGLGKISEYAGHHLQKLKAELKAADKPDWTERILEGLLDVSFLTGGALVGSFLAEKIVDKEVREIAGEFIKKACEEGVPAGTKAALGQLAGNSDPDPETFIEAQEDGVTAMYQVAQAQFLDFGQDTLATKQQAKALERAFDPAHCIAAAVKHHNASRDAYVSLLAKQTIGAAPGGQTTNMDSPMERMESGFGGHAPQYPLAMAGMGRGVLEVMVALDEDTTRAPRILGALINGVNETIRKQYEHTPLSSMEIPRQLVCAVRGDRPGFTVNVDERGAMHVVEGSPEWLEARARAAVPNADRLPAENRRKTGLDLLLSCLEIDEIGRGGFR